MLQGRVFGRLGRRLAGPLSLGLAFTLTGCAEISVGVEVAKRANRSLGEFELAQAQTAGAEQAPAVSPYLAPAPEIFEATGRATWDGKRTLQGIWVAHPLAKTARRVRIFNESNGRAVDGALFKRDTAQGASSILLSSEAAQMLGMSPGDQADLRIVAVTPVQEPQPAPAAPPAAVETVAASIPEAQPESRPEPEAAPAPPQPSAAASQAEPAEAEVAVAPAPETPATPASAPAVAPAPVPAPIPAADPEPLAPETDLPPEPEPDEDIAFRWEQDPVEPEPTIAAPAQPAVAPAAPQPEPRPVTEPELDDGPDEELDTDISFRWERAPTDPEAPQQATQPQPSGLVKPYVQAGIFGVADNATRLIGKLENMGIPALGRTINSGGRTLTRVVAGPFETRAQRDAAQSKIRKLGLVDAVPVKR